MTALIQQLLNIGDISCRWSQVIFPNRLRVKTKPPKSKESLSLSHKVVATFNLSLVQVSNLTARANLRLKMGHSFTGWNGFQEAGRTSLAYGSGQAHGRFS